MVSPYNAQPESAGTIAAREALLWAAYQRAVENWQTEPDDISLLTGQLVWQAWRDAFLQLDPRQ